MGGGISAPTGRVAVVTGAASGLGSAMAGVVPTMTADQTAEPVPDAVRARRFWILTHPEHRAVVRERAAVSGTVVLPTVPSVW